MIRLHVQLADSTLRGALKLLHCKRLGAAS